jgi:hypothetical protein
MSLGISLAPSTTCPRRFRSRATARRHFGVIPLGRISLSKANLTLVLRWVIRLQRKERIHTIHGILHNRLHFVIGDSGKTGTARARGTRLSSMDLLYWTISERQRNDCLRFPDDLAPSEITFHVR